MQEQVKASCVDLKPEPQRLNMKAELKIGWEVDEKRKKVMHAQLRLAQKLLDVCATHNLTCIAAFGTLRGAMICDGFLPWSHDMDFYMPRPDYDKLRECYADEFTHPFFLQSAQSDTNYYRAQMRLRDSNTTFIIPIDKDNRCCNNGIYIDIFPLDAVPDSGSKVKKAIYIKKAYFIRRVIYTMVYGTKFNHPGKGPMGVCKWLIIELVAKTLNLFSDYKRIDSLYQRYCAKYQGKTNRYSFFATYAPEFELTEEEAFDAVLHPFEEVSVYVPKHSESWLKKAYGGDYTSFPSVEERLRRQNAGIADAEIPYTEYLKKTKCR